MLKVSTQKIYYFLFFDAAYAFLSLWISVAYLESQKEFFIGGVLFYFVTIIFHRAIINISKRNEAQTNELAKIPKIHFFYFYVILFCVAYIVTTYFFQKLLIDYFNLSPKPFTIVSWALSLFAISVSFVLSFFERKSAKKH